MSPIFLIFWAIIAISSYANGYLSSSGEKYELVQGIRHYTIITFLIVSILCVILRVENMTIDLWQYFIVLAATALLPELLGEYCGNRGCDKKVK